MIRAAALLRAYRETNRITQDDLAGQIGIHPSALGRFERGASVPTGFYLAAILRWLLDEMEATDDQIRSTADVRPNGAAAVDQDVAPVCAQAAQNGGANSGNPVEGSVTAPQTMVWGLGDTRDQLREIQDRCLINTEGAGSVVWETIILRQYPQIDVERLCNYLGDTGMDWDAAITDYLA